MTDAPQWGILLSDSKKPRRCEDTPEHDTREGALVQTKTSTEDRGREGRITIVQSLTTSGKAYKVTDDSCSCPAFEHGKRPCKHQALRPALEKIRALDFGSDRHEARLMDLAKRLYSKPRKSETARESYDLTLEVDRERFAAAAMRRDSWKRHGVVVERCFGKEVA